jgi:hypothetical protein
MTSCHICGKQYYSRQTLQRHLAHHVGDGSESLASGVSESVASGVSKSVASGVSKSASIGSESDESMESDSVERTAIPNGKISDLHAADDVGEDFKFAAHDYVNPWKIMLKGVLTDGNNIEGPNGKLKWSKVIKRVKDKVTNLLEVADNLRDSEAYQLIQAEEYRLMQNGYENNEAEYAAWLNRKMAIKDVLQNALAEIAEGEEEQDEEEDEQEDEEEEEQEEEQEDEDEDD